MLPRALAAVALAALLAAVPSPALLHRSTTSSAAAGTSSLVTDARPVPIGSTDSPLAPSTPLELSITLAFSNASRLNRELAAVQDPRSPEYRHFLTDAEFNREFGPAPSTFAAVARSLESSGATSVVRAPGDTTIDAVMPAGALGRWLSVEPVSVRAAGESAGYTVLGTPTVPADLVGAVAGIEGLSDLEAAPDLVPALDVERAASPVSPQFVEWGTTGIDWYIGTDYAQAYGATELLPGGAESVAHATYPTGVAIATLLASGYNVPTGTALPPFDPAAVDAYFNETFPSGWPLPSLHGEPVTILGAPAPPRPGSSHGVADSFNYVTENSLDLEMAGSLAPGASLYNFYFNSSLLDAEIPPSLEQVAGYLADDFGAALNFTGYDGRHLAAVSCSFSLPVDLVNPQWDGDLSIAAMTGVTVLAASGDQGNAPDGVNIRNETASPVWPATEATNASGAIAVGGESIALSGRATGTYLGDGSAAPASPYDDTVTGISAAVVWADGDRAPDAYAGTEGGTSRNVSEPYWQFHSAAQPPIVNATELEGFSVLGRAEPDVAFQANNTIAYVGTNSTGAPTFEVLAGTSIAAPLFAGLLADVVAVENATRAKLVPGLGFLDPALYRIASFYRAHPTAAGDPFEEVTEGHNYLFSAAAGWNPTTGWGSLSGPLLLTALDNATLVNYTYTGPTPTLPSSAAPALSILELVAIGGAVAGVIAVAAVILASSRRRAAVAPVNPFEPYRPAPPTPPTAYAMRPPTAPYATFSCPYCGAPRPSEPGHCPHCGAM